MKHEPVPTSHEMRLPMNAEQRLIVVGCMLSSSLYLVMVFIAGILTAKPFAYDGAIATAGVCYLSYMIQLLSRNFPLALTSVIASVLCGAASGFALLW